MNKMVRLTPEIRQKIQSMKLSGMKSNDIAKELNVPRSTLYNVLGKSSKEATIIDQTTADDFIDSVKIPEAPAENITNHPFVQQLKAKLQKPKVQVQETIQEETGGHYAENTPEAEQPQITEIVKPEPVVLELSKTQLISKITILIQNYGSILSSHIKNQEQFLLSLKKMGLNELKSTYEVLDNMRVITNGSATLKNMFVIATSGIEDITQRFLKMKTQGFAMNIAKHDDELKNIFTELAEENSQKIKNIQNPTNRLAFLLVSTLLQTELGNRQGQPKENVEGIQNTEKYADL
jgi:hypothetical protein